MTPTLTVFHDGERIALGYTFLLDEDFYRKLGPDEVLQAEDYVELFPDTPVSLVAGSPFIGQPANKLGLTVAHPRAWRKLNLDEITARIEAVQADLLGNLNLTTDEIAAEEWVMDQERRYS